MKTSQTILGIDLGGTNVRAGLTGPGQELQLASTRIRANGPVEHVLEDIYSVTDQLFHPGISAIGIGVPSVVDVEEGIVYDVQNIPSWREVPLKAHMEARYKVPVLVNNDANCFVLGEKYFGKAKGVHAVVGLAIGTGMGAGIVVKDKLFSGTNCGAGEFGMVAYLDQFYEYYASGQYFKNVHQSTGEIFFQKAQRGESDGLAAFAELGTHIGNAIKMILYTYDPEMIILGGSIGQTYPFFQEAMWERIRTLQFGKTVERLRISVSELKHANLLGAASLWLDAEL
ncbi:glucokinase [Chitinophaga costaii]|uniref:Glucokinase n=1 Tax=Chitinophaga costaii TaxID=1335309 RepID=A0A1C4EJ54_9BACT|nr:ROK family protein [Chitinophaga costaii]PUZ23792.1 ROK family protein [Chitinophaga costaii]SCC43512.1 glucokinase [Chitinophaga costaii]